MTNEGFFLREVTEIPQPPDARKPNPVKLAYQAFKDSDMQRAAVKIPGKGSHYVYMYLRELAHKDDTGIYVIHVDSETYLEKR